MQFMNLVAGSFKDGEADLQKFTNEFIKSMNPRFELELEPNMPAAHCPAFFNAQGPNLNCLTACAASSQRLVKRQKSSAEVMPT